MYFDTIARNYKKDVSGATLDLGRLVELRNVFLYVPQMCVCRVS